jgi:2-dehydro-3-deoxygalactonokinase
MTSLALGFKGIGAKTPSSALRGADDLIWDGGNPFLRYVMQDTPYAILGMEQLYLSALAARDGHWDGAVSFGNGTWVQMSAGETIAFQKGCFDLAADCLDPEVAQLAAHEGGLRADRLPHLIARAQDRAAVNETTAAEAQSYIIGASVGADIATAKPYWLGNDVKLVSLGKHGKVYEEAMSALAIPVTVIDARELLQEALAGLGL